MFYHRSKRRCCAPRSSIRRGQLRNVHRDTAAQMFKARIQTIQPYQTADSQASAMINVVIDSLYGEVRRTENRPRRLGIVLREWNSHCGTVKKSTLSECRRCLWKPKRRQRFLFSGECCWYHQRHIFSNRRPRLLVLQAQNTVKSKHYPHLSNKNIICWFAEYNASPPRQLRTYTQRTLSHGLIIQS